MQELNVKVKKLNEDALLPVYATEDSACMDILYKNGISRKDWVYRGDRYTYLAKTGLSFEIPKGHVMLVFSRSGHGFKHGCRLVNSTGVIDADYRGELGVKLSTEVLFEVEPGQAIAQFLVIPYPRINLVESTELSETARGAGGFGSTDKVA